MSSRVSLAELANADIQLRPAEAVAVVVEICRQYSSGRIRGIPSPGIIRLTPDGTIVAEGPITADAEFGVRRAAHLLSDLLPDFDAPAAYRASGGLRLVVARALGTLDLPPYPTLEAFCEALTRFSVVDLGTAVRSLYRAWEGAVAMRRSPEPPPALTISDIRRARRATGLSLEDLSAVADVPTVRLRELELGYLRNWRADDDGRAEVVRYAKAAGLDETVVLSIAWPMIEEAARLGDEPRDEIVALVPRRSEELVLVPPTAPHGRPAVASWGVVAGASAILALATFGLMTGATQDTPSRQAAASEPAVPAGGGAAPSAKSASAGEQPQPMAASAPAPAAVSPKRQWQRRPAPAAVAPAVRRGVAARQTTRPVHASRRAFSPARSFFRRELFRIVIR